LAIVAIDLAKAKQAVAVLDHDSQVVGRKLFACSPWGLGQALDWAEQIAVEAGFDGVVAAFEPTGHRWKPLRQVCADRGVGAVCVQPLLVHRGREAEDVTRDRSDLKDAVIIGRLAGELRGYLPQAPTAHWARLRGVGRAVPQPRVRRHVPASHPPSNRLTDAQARTAVAAALLRQLHAICTRGVRWDPAIAAGTPAEEVTAAA
jgi:hypothetical protein